MLDHILEMTSRLKMQLLALGRTLPPPMAFSSNKLLQIGLDYRHMVENLKGRSSNSLFENATTVYWMCTGTYDNVQNLLDLHNQLRRLCNYLDAYIVKKA